MKCSLTVYCVVCMLFAGACKPDTENFPRGDDKTLADPPSAPSTNPHSLDFFQAPGAAPTPQEGGAQALAEVADAPSLFRSALAKLNRGEIDDSIRSFQECVGADPTFARCYRGLAIAFARASKGADAAQAYRRYLDVAPEAADAPAVRKILEDYERRRTLK